MDTEINGLMEKIRALEADLEVATAKRGAELHHRMEDGKAVFEEEVRRRHIELRKGLAAYIFQARPLIMLSAPVIYAVIVPFVLLDLFVSLYQAVCFPIYGLEKVRRADYLVFDRSQLAYLNALEKLNCAYCSYGNGLIAYVREIVGRTELYWCPIKHARRVLAVHPEYARFVDYGDADAFRALSEKTHGDSASP